MDRHRILFLLDRHIKTLSNAQDVQQERVQEVNLSTSMSSLAELRYSDPFTVLIISGHSGCRGPTFKDRDHCTIPKSAMHLTDFYFSIGDSASGENIVQTPNRISGTYPGKPTLRLWTSEAEYALMEKKQDEIDNIYMCLSQRPNEAPRDALRDHGAHLEAFLRGLEDGHPSILTASQQVQVKLQKQP